MAGEVGRAETVFVVPNPTTILPLVRSKPRSGPPSKRSCVANAARADSEIVGVAQDGNVDVVVDDRDRYGASAARWIAGRRKRQRVVAWRDVSEGEAAELDVGFVVEWAQRHAAELNARVAGAEVDDAPADGERGSLRRRRKSRWSGGPRGRRRGARDAHLFAPAGGDGAAEQGGQRGLAYASVHPSFCLTACRLFRAAFDVQWRVEVPRRKLRPLASRRDGSVSVAWT